MLGKVVFLLNKIIEKNITNSYLEKSYKNFMKNGQLSKIHKNFIDEKIGFSEDKNKRKTLKNDRDRKIIEKYLKAFNTQEDIAEILGIEQVMVSRVIDEITQNGKFSEMGNLNSSLLLYNRI